MKTLDDWLDYQQHLHPTEIELGLERIQNVYQRLFPQGLSFQIISVAGTNGKGSTCTLIESIYQQAGVKTGKFSSPHIRNYNERFSVNGKNVNDAKICQAFEQIELSRDGISLTYFEFSTLAALLIFTAETVDIAILEVGLGGRLDSVNVVDSDLAIITNVALDHTEYLGETREQIGFEKAGIMRPSKPCLCADDSPPQSLIKYAKSINADLQWVTQPYLGDIGLAGEHQRRNAALAIKAVETLMPRAFNPVLARHQQQGIEKAQLDGRLQTLSINDKTVVLVLTFEYIYSCGSLHFCLHVFWQRFESIPCNYKHPETETCI